MRDPRGANGVTPPSHASTSDPRPRRRGRGGRDGGAEPWSLERRVWTAAATLSYYLASLVVGLDLLEHCQAGRHAEQLLFEVASALGTVGLSTGITADLSAPGKWVLVILMFCGRLGPLVLGVALFPRAETGAAGDVAGVDRGPADLVT